MKTKQAEAVNILTRIITPPHLNKQRIGPVITTEICHKEIGPRTVKKSEQQRNQNSIIRL